MESLDLRYDVSPKELFPGVLIFEDVISFSDEDIQLFTETINNYVSSNISIEKYVKNVLWNIFKQQDKEYFISDMQKIVLNGLAKYCDFYPEAIHPTQWQEQIKAIIDLPGGEDKIFNPSRSTTDEDGNIDYIPFSRSVVAELFIENNVEGGNISWNYLPGININNVSSGSLILYPANFLFSRKESTIISGRRIYIRTFFNGGKDFLAEASDLEKKNELLYSYMR